MKKAMAFSLLVVSVLAASVVYATPGCPDSWLGHPTHGRYAQDGYPVCDYYGSVDDAQCNAIGAMQTEGPHGKWCQKFTDNNRSLLLSVARGAASSGGSVTLPAAEINCPKTWLDHPLHGHFSQKEMQACDYNGHVSDTACTNDGGTLVGSLCQKPDKKHAVLLSMMRE